MAFLGKRHSSEVWHQRLGHPLAQVLQLLKSSDDLEISRFLNHNKICESCQLAKNQKLPFGTSSRHSYSPLELIHCDLWGPMVPSVSGFHSYIIFVDDYSRHTWIYPLLAKSNALECFRHFKLMAENIFFHNCQILPK